MADTFVSDDNDADQTTDYRMSGLLFGCTVVVVGAASGIGQACAIAAAHEGASVVAADCASMQQTRDLLSTTQSAWIDSTIDVTDDSQWRELVAETLDRFGKINGVVLAAGIARHVPLLQMTRGEWDEMLAVHLTGTFLGIQTTAPALQTAGGGSIVYLSSSVTAGLGPLHQSHYVAAKSGALGLVRAAARELGPDRIRVNAVSPGFTLTPMNVGLFTVEEIQQRAASAPLGRVANSKDVADTVIFLLSERSSMTTGQNLQVNGGSHMP